MRPAPPSGSEPPRRFLRPETALFTLVLAAMVGMPALSVDMSLPALSVITAALGARPALGGLTISVLLVGFGFTQLVFGPLADRYGRRPVLLLGLVLFWIAGALCGLSLNLPMLLAARLLQGIGAAAGTVLAFAMVRDCFEGAAARTRLAYVSAVMNLGPVVAPVIGAFVLEFAGWRAIFGVLTAIGLLLFAVVALAMPETIRVRNPRAMRLDGLLANYARAIANRRAFAHMLLGALLFGDLFSFISGSPLVYINHFGLSSRQFALIFAVTSSGLMAGSLVVGKFDHGPLGQMFMPAGIMLAGLAGCAMLALNATGLLGVPVSVVLLVLNAFACGLAFPNATHGAIDPFPDMAGVASALNGALRMAGGALSSALMAALYDGSARAMATGIAAFGLASLGLWALRIRVRPLPA